MSEEILKALMQLFAIIAKQDVGLSLNEREYVHLFLKQQLNESAVKEYLNLFDEFVGFNKKKSESEQSSQEITDKPKKTRLTSVKDSVKTLGIAKKINKTLTQKQKVVVLVRLFELVNADKNFTSQRIAIIDTVAEVFNISKEEYISISEFVTKETPEEINQSDIMIVADENVKVNENCKKLVASNLHKYIFILRVASVDLYFIRYNGNDEIFLNGLPISNTRIYLFASGSVVKLPKSKPIFYSDVAAKFLADTSFANITFQAIDVSYTFPNGNVGLVNFNICESSGRLVGIMGASGSGKTTLLNVLSGIEKPTNGLVWINGIDIFKEKEKIKGVIGYIPQDDLLIEDLTVYENLYFAAKLIFRDYSEEEINKQVLKVLNNLGLLEIKDLKVGTPLNKKISGGQRKRLNIGLELIREPSILFVDEPTSGLSSRDSENVMDLLRELTLKGKLIFVVIHQPSSDIYKMFDHVIILDHGGYQIYYGNPVEAVMYFKKHDNQVGSDIGECPTCGNVNPESIFNIIEARIVDEYGRFTDKRKVSPVEWYQAFKVSKILSKEKASNDPLPEPPKKPSLFTQFKVFFLRDMLAKLANKQYLIVTFLEAPIIAIVLAFILRYTTDPSASTYIYRENDNIMPYIFMAVIVALFLGLTLSAEEIFKDRKILKREAFLDLSRNSYLLAKVSILFIISAIQAFSFVLFGNWILGIKDMYFEYWLIFFSMAALANILGLNISSSFDSAVTIYILIPFIIIPQMVLAGAMFSFDKINKYIGGGREKVPLIAEFMPSRWGFEALLVKQFVDNKYEQILYDKQKNITLYDLEKKESNYNFKYVYLIPELKGILQGYKLKRAKGNKDIKYTKDDCELLFNEFSKEMKLVPHVRFNHLSKLNPNELNEAIEDSALAYLENLAEYYKKEFNKYNGAKDELITELQKTPEMKEKFLKIYDDYYNQNLAIFAKNTYAMKPILRLNNRFIQKLEPIYLDPQDISFLNFRTHFLAPRKYFLGTWFSTYVLNLIVIWIFSIILYILLYFEALKKLFFLFEKLKSYNEKFFNNFTKILNSFFQRIIEKVRLIIKEKLEDNKNKKLVENNETEELEKN